MPLTEINLHAIWQQVLAEAGFALAGELRKAASVAISGPNTLALRVSERYNTAGANGADAARWTRAEPLLSRVVGQPCTIRVEFFREAAEAPTAPAAGTTKQLRERVKQLPQVQKARDVLGAEILHVDPDFGEVSAPAPVPLSEDATVDSPEED